MKMMCLLKLVDVDRVLFVDGAMCQTVGDLHDT